MQNIKFLFFVVVKILMFVKDRPPGSIIRVKYETFLGNFWHSILKYTNKVFVVREITIVKFFKTPRLKAVALYTVIVIFE